MPWAACNPGEDAVERIRRQVPPYAGPRAYARLVVELPRHQNWMVIRRDQLSGE